jgi:dipeptidyl aminopeptidase/acylaminoacyl peptidase
MVRRLVLAGLVILLTACGASETATPTAAIAVTVYPTQTTAATATSAPTSTALPTLVPTPADTATPQPPALHPLTIESMRQREYPGSDIVIEETLSPGSNYNRYYVSYLSEGLKIYALLTVPRGEKPATGWPVVVFNHGYIPPDVYKTTERYVAYVDAFARNGYIVLRSDYRGHDRSEGEPTGAYGSPGYVIDVLNAVASVKRYPDADPNRIGMWGHSMGGYITLRSMVINKDIKAGVIWAGVVASYTDLLTRWRRNNNPTSTPDPNAIPPGARRWRQTLQEQYGPPEENPEFWNSISANSFLADLSGPVQLHHGTADADVPVEFSNTLEQQIVAVGGMVENFTYPGDNHNISGNLGVALTRSVQFFDKYVKGVG